MTERTLAVITGPTGSGKTDLAIALAQRLGTEIVSADSRQIYRDIPIGTAAPTAEQRGAVPHHFVGTLPLDAYYSAACYESDVLELLPQLWERSESNVVVMCGGSMMYVDAVTKGIDQLPTISPEVRSAVLEMYQQQGLEGIRAELQRLDPMQYGRVDLNNHRRIIHAIEICMEAGQPCSTLLTGRAAERPFKIVKMAIDYERSELFDRINRRVDAMMEAGLEEEAHNVYHLRALNSLNTVGYKEMFAMFDGTMTRAEAVARIAKNTRVYAKKQMLWMRNSGDVTMLRASSALDDALKILS